MNDFVNYDLETLAKNLYNEFVDSKPFNHLIIDDLFTNDLIVKLKQNFPNKNDKIWWEYDNPLEKKLAFNAVNELDEIYSLFFSFVNSKEFITFLENLSGLKNLISDPTLRGGGLHQTLKGGKLDIHEDFNVNQELDAFRKLNLIVYLNDNWEDEYKGHLELWDKDMSMCVKSILPTLGRCVIFRTDQCSNHGHPHPLLCPEETTRKSLAVYYYEPVDGRSYVYKSTHYKKLPNESNDPLLDSLRLSRLKGRLEDKTSK